MKRGRLRTPVRCFFYGAEGVGKSTLAAGAPKPLWIDADDGSARLDVARYPFRDGPGGHVPRTYAEILAAIDDLISTPHDFGTLVIDTVDRLEKMIWSHLLERDKSRSAKDGKLDSIEDYGYGKGYTMAVDEWISFCTRLDRLRARGMSIILIAHAQVKNFKNPIGPDYDRFVPALNDKAAGFIKQWADVTGFVCHDDEGAKPMGEGRNARAKGFSTGRHLLRLEHSAAYDAKSRLALPGEVEIDIADPWAPFAKALEEAYESEIPKLVEGIAAQLERIGDEELTGKVNAAVKTAADDAVKLARFLADLQNRQPKPAEAE